MTSLLDFNKLDKSLAGHFLVVFKVPQPLRPPTSCHLKKRTIFPTILRLLLDVDSPHNETGVS